MDRNALSARLREREIFLPPVCGYTTPRRRGPDEITNEALYRACRAYGLGERFLAAVKDELEPELPVRHVGLVGE